MYCGKCGKELNGTEAFCTGCGAPVIKKGTATSTKTTKPHKAKKKRVSSGFVGFVLVVLILAGAGLLLFTDVVKLSILTELQEFVVGIFEKAENDNPMIEYVPGEETIASTLNPIDQAYTDTKEHCTELVEQGDYDGAITYLESQKIVNPQDMRYDILISECMSLRKENILQTAETMKQRHEFRQAIKFLDEMWKQHQDTDYCDLAADYRMAFGQYSNSVMAAGKYNSAVILDGNVYVVGNNEFGELGANSWSDIVEIGVGDRYVVGLHNDGTVSITGAYAENQPATNPGWQNIVAIAAGDLHAVGLTSNGRLVAVGYNGYGQTNVDAIMQMAAGRRIVAIAAGYTHTLALLEDGTVVACGDNSNGACNVSSWTDVVAIYAGTKYSAALMSDGSVRVTGLYDNMFNSSSWSDIDALSAGDYFLVGLKADGSVIADALDKSNKNHSDEGQLDVDELTDIVHIAAGHNHVMALGSNGIVQCLGRNSKGGCDIDGIEINITKNK